MLYDWAYLENPVHSEYKETYFLRTTKGDELRVEVNRPQGMVRLTLLEHNGQKWQSIISNGVVLRERDLTQNRSKDLEAIFSRYRFDLSSLPDNQVLRLIGGNYGVLTEFIGRSRKVNKISLPSPQNVKEWINRFLKESKIKIKKKLKNFYLLFMAPPRWSDIQETLFIGVFTSYAFQVNYSFVVSGFFLCVGALLCGLADYFIKKRSPYLLKVTLLFLLGGFVLSWGFYYQ